MIATARDATVERILALVRDRVGLRLAPGRWLDADAGVRRAMAGAGYRDLRRYLGAIETNDVSLDGLVAELTVRETYFFRERAHFDFVRHTHSAQREIFNGANL